MHKPFDESAFLANRQYRFGRHAQEGHDKLISFQPQFCLSNRPIPKMDFEFGSCNRIGDPFRYVVQTMRRIVLHLSGIGDPDAKRILLNHGLNLVRIAIGPPPNV